MMSWFLVGSKISAKNRYENHLGKVCKLSLLMLTVRLHEKRTKPTDLSFLRRYTIFQFRFSIPFFFSQQIALACSLNIFHRNFKKFKAGWLVWYPIVVWFDFAWFICRRRSNCPDNLLPNGSKVHSAGACRYSKFVRFTQAEGCQDRNKLSVW